MAEENEGRTEAATPARLSRAQAEGQAPVSHELAALANLGAALLVIAALAPALGAGLAQQLARLLGSAGRTDGAASLAVVLRQLASSAASAYLPLALAVLALGAGAVLIQTSGAARPTALMPDFSRISPMRGLSRLFSPNNGVNAVKSILKICLLSFALWLALRAQFRHLPASLEQNFGGVSAAFEAGIVRVGATLMVGQALIAMLDLGWSRFSFVRAMRMSPEEIKQEHKASEGDPQIKARRRAIRKARVRQNLKKAMTGATVVVTNPTHYAVALHYARDSKAAPKIIAKGTDEMAARIRELAAEQHVPVVANPPLARALHKLELESEIPLEHYKAVADIIAYIWGLEAKAARGRMI
jgi:flagellar biosynthetic protein FlhB